MDEIFNRGTCRYFKELTPVPDEELLTLVKAGMQARAVGNQKNILIEAEHLGLSTLWMQVYPYQDRKIHLCHILDISTDEDPFCIIAVGYADRRPVRLNRYDEKAVSYDLYGNHKKK